VVDLIIYFPKFLNLDSYKNIKISDIEIIFILLTLNISFKYHKSFWNFKCVNTLGLSLISLDFQILRNALLNIGITAIQYASQTSYSKPLN